MPRKGETERSAKIINEMSNQKMNMEGLRPGGG